MNLMELFVKIGVHDDVTGRIGMIGNSIRSGLGTAARAAGLAMAAAGAGVVAFGASAVRTGMDFDASMSQVAATMGTTVDQIGELRDFAQEMGRTTMFSATQAAEALNYMALAGYDAQTSMKMLPNVLNLAAAGNMDLATASDMVTDAQSAFGLSIEQTNRMVDQMAKAASTGNTSVQQLGDAMLTVGATARVLKGGTGEAAQVLTLLADNGIKASEGGTALRNILMRLSAPTDKARQQFEELGVQVFDSQGNMRSMQDIMLDLQKAMDGMSDSERQERLAKMFNKYDLAAVNALLGTNADRWYEVAAAIDDCEGAAAQMAETQMDNLAGDITYLKSAFEGLQIAVSDELQPALRQFVQGATDGVGALTRMVESNSFKSFISGVGDAFKRAIDFISGFLSVLFPATDASDEAGISFDKMSSTLDTAGQMMKSVTSLADGLAVNFGLVKEQGDNMAQSEAFKAGAALAETFRSITAAVNEFVTAFTETADFDKMGEALNGLAEAVRNALDLPDDNEGAGTAVGDAFNTLADIIIAVTPIIAAGLAEMKDQFELVRDVVTTLRDAFGEFQEICQTVQDTLSPFAEFIGVNLKSVLETFGVDIDGTNTKLDGFGQKFEGVTTIVKSALDGLMVVINLASATIQGLMEYVGSTPGRVSAAIETIMAFVGSIPSRVMGFLWSLPSLLMSVGTNAMNGLHSGIVSAWNAVASFVSSIPSRIWSALGNLGNMLWSAGWNVLMGFYNGAVSAWNQMSGWISSIGGWIQSHKGPLDYDRKLLVENGEAIMQGLNVGLKSGYKDVVDTVSGMGLGISANVDASSKGAQTGGISGEIASLREELRQMRLVLNIDGRAFAEATVGEMDRAMGNMARRAVAR